MPVKPRIKFAPGKTYTYSGTEGVYSVIAGEILEGDAVPAGGNLVFGEGAPGSGTGKTNDVYLDITNFKLHTKGNSGWDAGTVFKGANGSNGAPGANGKSVRFGSGAPSSGLGDNDDVYLDITDFKLHTKSAGSWSSGTAFKGTSGVKGASLLQGTTAPGAGDGDDGDTFLDAVNHTIYKKTGGVWASQGSSFKGTKGDSGSKGDAGQRGKTTLEGSGAPGTGTNLATPTAALTAALADESLTAADLVPGDLYVDTTNHRFYRKTSLGWTARTVFKGADGAQGLKGDTGSAGLKGDDGAGVNKYSTALTADTYLSTGATASTATTSGSAAYPATLNLTDTMENVGSVVTRGSVTYNRASGTTATGSRFTIGVAGRYKIDYFATYNVTASSSSANSVNLNMGIYYSTDAGSTWSALQTQTATFSTASTTTAQTTLELSKTAFLPANTLIEFRASRGTSDVNTVVTVNAVTKTEVGDDTFVVITKL